MCAAPVFTPKNAWSQDPSSLLSSLRTSANGLSSSQAQERLALNGLNEISKQKTLSPLVRILLSQLTNWLVLVLLFASGVSFFLGEKLDSLIVIIIVFSSIFFGFLQEYKASKALERLKKFISYKAKVKRDGSWLEIDSREVVLGDILKLQTGDFVPADIRLLKAINLTADEAVLTGESLPVPKKTKLIPSQSAQPHQLSNMVFAGTTIVSGEGEGIVVATGNQTLFGQTSVFLERIALKTAFQKDTEKFSLFLFRLILLMAIFVFGVNAWQRREVFDSFLFALALAVGITPELLPAILTMTLSQGALKMAHRQVVVKRLMSVEDLGNMDTLCTDKTGTLTQGVFSLATYVDFKGVKNLDVFLKALLCTTDVGNQGIDQALKKVQVASALREKLATYEIIKKQEFDFNQRLMRVVVRHRGKFFLIAKGAPEAILKLLRPASFNYSFNYQEILKKIKAEEENGYRVIAVAEKELSRETTDYKKEKDLTPLGLLLFHDPIKPEIKKSLELFQKLGVKVKILSGDSPIITRKVARQVGFQLSDQEVISGEQLEGLSASQIEKMARQYDFFARVTPIQKEQIVASLNQEGHVVGFLGDGINDAPALKAADVGMAVDTGTAVAKEAADIILLQKDLKVLAQGIIMGRKTFGNVMKYILNTVSANYGNMFTVALASLFLKFIPLLPKQILLNNLLSDLPLFAIATDKVDARELKRPRKWNINFIRNFMIVFGFLSSVFDLLLILPMIFIWKLPPEIFRTAWFVESALSEMLVTFAIRTPLPFYQSLPSRPLLLTTFFAGFGVILFMRLNFGRQLFDFTALPSFLWLYLGLLLLVYFLATEIAKHLFYKTKAFL
jgi:Mg2+-importing ATPase